MFRSGQVKFDPRALNPSVSEVLAALQRRDFRAVEAAFKGLVQAEISLLLEGVSDLVDRDDLLDEWYADREGPDLAALLRGTILRKRAWFYRGGGGAESVTEEGWVKMRETLLEAQRSLSPITDNPVYGSEACGRLINVHKGLSSDWIVIDDIFERMTHFGHINLIGEIYYLNASCEKWLGSHDKMFDFARKRAEVDPELGALIAAAHYERHMFLERFDEEFEAADRYKKHPDVLGEIFDAQEKLIKAYDPQNHDYVLAHNIFACVISVFTQFKGAAPSFALTKKRFTPYPWLHEDDAYLPYAYKTAMGYKKAYMNAGGVWPQIFAD